MLPRGAGAQDWHLDMQLMGKVVLSATTLLLVTAVYRLYKLRPAPALPRGGNGPARAEEEADVSEQPAVQRASPGALRRGQRRRRTGSGAGVALGCSWEDPGGPSVLASEEPCGDGKSLRQGEEGPDSQQVPPHGSGQEARTAPGEKPTPPCGSPLAADSSSVGGKPAPCPDRGLLPQPGLAERGSPSSWVVPTEGSRDMNQRWLFNHAAGVSREEAGTLQAASDMDLALQQQAGATSTSYTFSSVARVRVEENFLGQVGALGPRLKGKVYDYYVESTSQATSLPALRSAALAEPPPPGRPPGALGIGVASGGPADDPEGGAHPSWQPALSPSERGVSRKDSLLQIAENPELQLQLHGFGSPAAGSPDQEALPGSPGGGEEPYLQAVAGTSFFRSPSSAPDVCLDLGNCYEALTLAKRQNLAALREAAYQVMSNNYLQVLRSPDIYGRLSGAERELILQRRLRGRQHLVVADVSPQEGCGRLCCYDDVRDVWHPLARLPPEAVSQGCAICSLFNYLFVVSGCQGLEASNRVFCYNPSTGIWSEVSPLNQARPHCRLVALEGYLYAIGGECLNTVERYDPRLDRWAFAPPLPNDTFAVAHTATVCAEEIFVTGGTLRYLLLRFSPREWRWWAGPTGGSKDRTAEMVAVDGFLYRFDLNRSLGISVYRCGASTRLWYECATYRVPHPDPFQCAVVGGHIYCVGRRRVLCFLADHISPRFVSKELQHFPSPQGTLLPAVLSLPGLEVPQTQV
ncbi:kelch domain-containing protein 7A [Ctenodactylus gundi]